MAHAIGDDQSARSGIEGFGAFEYTHRPSLASEQGSGEESSG
jgi:hypothetical protein